MLPKKLMNKKGVSPLIATVLLIAFAVALGAIVMNWGRGYVEDTQSFARSTSESQLICSSAVDLDFNVKNVVVDLQQGSYAKVNMTIEGMGDHIIESFVIQLFNDPKGQGITIYANNTTTDRLQSFQVKNYNFSVNRTGDNKVENITRFVMIPRILSQNDNQTACPNKKVEIKSEDIKYVP
jgi:flagellin-like protein